MREYTYVGFADIWIDFIRQCRHLPVSQSFWALFLAQQSSLGCDFPLLKRTSTFGWKKSNPTKYLFILIDCKENLKALNQQHVCSKLRVPVVACSILGTPASFCPLSAVQQLGSLSVYIVFGSLVKLFYIMCTLQHIHLHVCLGFLRQKSSSPKFITLESITCSKEHLVSIRVSHSLHLAKEMGH